MCRLGSIEETFEDIKKDMDARDRRERNNPDSIKTVVSILYAYNASGKTRLSKLFADRCHGRILYYNAFTEDLFVWDNEECILTVDPNNRIVEWIQEEGMESRIADNFRRFTGSELEPLFDMSKGVISFGFSSGNDEDFEPIKISRGEESVFIWSIFYTILNIAIDALNENPDGWATDRFDEIQYVVIDDPVSSMDETRLISVALDLAAMIAESRGQLKFLVTTHHALFFNILFNTRKKAWNKRNYILSKSDAGICLKIQDEDSPFAYHHGVMAEIKNAIGGDGIRKYHFNLFRSLLEKTANFLGYRGGWKKCLPKQEEGDEVLMRTLDHYSHNSLSDLEPNDLSADEKEAFKRTFQAFLRKFKFK